MSKTPAPYTIRPAVREDLPRILRFIQGLADHVHYDQKLPVTLEDLGLYLFDRPQVFCLIGEVQGVPRGFALYFPTFSTFLGKPGLYLEDLFVEKEFRGRGLGRALIQELAALAVREGYPRLEWASQIWDDRAQEFYQGLGAQRQETLRIFRLAGEALQAFAAPEASL